MRPGVYVAIWSFTTAVWLAAAITGATDVADVVALAVNAVMLGALLRDWLGRSADRDETAS